jgi:hypothetical protein
MSLPSDVCDCTFAMVEALFSDYKVFPQISDELKQAIPHLIATKRITTSDIKKVANKYSLFGKVSTEQKAAELVVERIFQTTTVYVLAMREENRAIQWATVDDLLFHYPQFVEASDDERLRLLRFRNAMRVALTVLPAKRNKDRLLRIASKLEGAGRDYITGTGQSEDVDRRVAIYEMEGGVEAEKRQPRERRPMIDRANNRAQRHSRKRERYLQLYSPLEENAIPELTFELEDLARSFALQYDHTALENHTTPRKRANLDAGWFELEGKCARQPMLYQTPVVCQPVFGAPAHTEDWVRVDDATDVSPLTDIDEESLDLTDADIDLANLDIFDPDALDGFDGVDRSHLFGDGDLGDLQHLAYLL